MISFARNIISFVRNNISFVRNIISFISALSVSVRLRSPPRQWVSHPGPRTVSECQTQVPALSVSVRPSSPSCQWVSDPGPRHFRPRSPPCQWVSDPGHHPASEWHTQVISYKRNNISYKRDNTSYKRNIISCKSNNISSKRNIISSKRNIIPYTRNIISYKRNIISYKRNNISYKNILTLIIIMIILQMSTLEFMRECYQLRRNGRIFPTIVNASNHANWTKREKTDILDVLIKNGAVFFRNLGLQTAEEFNDFAKSFCLETFGEGKGSLSWRDHVIDNVYG